MEFPYNIPSIGSFRSLAFKTPITIFSGENGTGKSTLIEAMAIGMNAVAIGSENLDTDKSLDKIRKFSGNLRFVKNRIPKRSFFFRAEDFFGFIKKVKTELRDYKELRAEYEDEYTGYAKMLTTGMAEGQYAALKSRYGEDPDAFSHGESFINLFQSRMIGGGLYFLDEPETPLSPQRQLAFISLIKDLVKRECQFVIATHSPMIMALPEAQIFTFDGPEIKTVEFDEVEHVKLMRSFLKDPDNYIRRL